MNKETIAVAMSGGVDSSVAAALCQQKGYPVIGLTMKLWDGKDSLSPELQNSCYGPGEVHNIENAEKVADKLGIPLHVVDCSEDFQQKVLEYFRQEYLSGRTPNPCVTCNRSIKFEALIQKAERSGIDFDLFATGHYCRTGYTGKSKRFLLKKGKDPDKDQSYFLAFLSQEQLRRTVFPVGDYTKREVRELARHFEFGMEDKPESQDFIAAGYRSIIGETKTGRIVNTRGEVLGEHPGITNFTIGQRKGLGISAPEPQYVTDIDPETGDITVGGIEDIYAREFTASGLNWISVERLEEPTKLNVKIRYAHEDAPAMITPEGNDSIAITFDEPQMAITPGQAAVLYDNDTVVGAGIIEKNDNGK